MGGRVERWSAGRLRTVGGGAAASTALAGQRQVIALDGTTLRDSAADVAAAAAGGGRVPLRSAVDPGREIVLGPSATPARADSPPPPAPCWPPGPTGIC